MDENLLLGGYWHYAHAMASRQREPDASAGSLVQLYEADVSPAGSAYDRACELWQMIVGIDKVKEIADKMGCTVAEVVYGR